MGDSGRLENRERTAHSLRGYWAAFTHENSAKVSVLSLNGYQRPIAGISCVAISDKTQTELLTLGSVTSAVVKEFKNTPVDNGEKK